MTERFLSTLAAGAVAAAGLSAADTVDAGWHHAPTNSYFHAPGGCGYSPMGYVGTTGARYSLYGQNYGYSSYFSPPYSPYGIGAAHGVGPAYGVGPGYGVGQGYGVAAPYGAVGNPRGELEYDVYTPFGRQEIEYNFRRNGRVDVDYDD
jgi:hypothetical protein